MSYDIKPTEYYDENTQYYENFIKKVSYITFILSDIDLDHNRVVLLDKDKKELFRSRIESLGSYYPTGDAWVWGWAHPAYTKNRTYLSRKLLKYGLDIRDKSEMKLKYKLITSRITINHILQLDELVANGSYLTKHPFILEVIFPLEASDDITDSKDYHNYIMEYKTEHSSEFYYKQFYYMMDFQNLDKSLL